MSGMWSIFDNKADFVVVSFASTMSDLRWDLIGADARSQAVVRAVFGPHAPLDGLCCREQQSDAASRQAAVRAAAAKAIIYQDHDKWTQLKNIPDKSLSPRNMNALTRMKKRKKEPKIIRFSVEYLPLSLLKHFLKHSKKNGTCPLIRGRFCHRYLNGTVWTLVVGGDHSPIFIFPVWGPE